MLTRGFILEITSALENTNYVFSVDPVKTNQNTPGNTEKISQHCDKESKCSSLVSQIVNSDMMVQYSAQELIVKRNLAEESTLSVFLPTIN